MTPSEEDNKICELRIKEVENRLEEIDRERRNLIKELNALRSLGSSIPPPQLAGIPVSDSTPENPEQKIELFIKLFRARESVYPKYWENPAKNIKGYSPACANEWVRPLCDKPRVKCSECPNQAFPKFDESAVRDHLQGKQIIGTYAIRENDTCTFIAADFDGAGWNQDVIAYRSSARELGIHAAVERSKSGNGAHAWIFFSEPIPARIARQLGTVVLARVQGSRHSISLETYDRFFPNQDFIPKGGFGNLIALPLQKAARENKNSVFLNEELNAYDDQWKYLSEIRRLTLFEVESILQKQLSETAFTHIQFEDESVGAAERALDSGSHKVISGSYPGQIEIEHGAQLSINVDGLPSSIFSAFKRTAIFANPVFFEKQRMRLSTWNIPRFIFCGDIKRNRLILPRGSLDACMEIAEKAGSSIVIKDTRVSTPKLKVQFEGELSAPQKTAVSEMLKFETGVLVAPPGAGKTVMACAMIAKRKTNTLILVHRTQLMDQWRNRLSEFLGLTKKEIGTFSGSKKKQGSGVDIGILSFAQLKLSAEWLAVHHAA